MELSRYFLTVVHRPSERTSLLPVIGVEARTDEKALVIDRNHVLVMMGTLIKLFGKRQTEVGRPERPAEGTFVPYPAFTALEPDES